MIIVTLEFGKTLVLLAIIYVAIVPLSNYGYMYEIFFRAALDIR